MKAIAFCGLACCVCSENKGCVGCQNGGCESHGWCKNYNCCKEKGLNGCWECSEFPFTGCMLDKPRIRAFAEFARRYRVRTVILHLFYLIFFVMGQPCYCSHVTLQRYFCISYP